MLQPPFHNTGEMKLQKKVEKIGAQVNTAYKAGLYEILLFWKPWAKAATVMVLTPNQMFPQFQTMQDYHFETLKEANEKVAEFKKIFLAL